MLEYLMWKYILQSIIVKAVWTTYVDVYMCTRLT